MYEKSPFIKTAVFSGLLSIEEGEKLDKNEPINAVLESLMEHPDVKAYLQIAKAIEKIEGKK